MVSIVNNQNIHNYKRQMYKDKPCFTKMSINNEKASCLLFKGAEKPFLHYVNAGYKKVKKFINECIGKVYMFILKIIPKIFKDGLPIY